MAYSFVVVHFYFRFHQNRDRALRSHDVKIGDETESEDEQKQSKHEIASEWKGSSVVLKHD